ncbi:MAG TPA: hypothetical protein VID93_08280 [Acidimicrobiales bacterium]
MTVFRLHRPHPLKALRDLCVYAPIGFLVESPRLIPELITVGRQHVEAARGLGQMAMQMRQQLRAQGSAPRTEPSGTSEPASTSPIATGQRDEELVVEVIHEHPDLSSSDEGLAIPGYDQLAASQVVARLSGLGPVELDQVAAYEEAHRGRRTILNKITQLRRR